MSILNAVCAQSLREGHHLAMTEIEIVVANLRFLARLETEKAPKTSAKFRSMLPLKAKILQARWSGESAWIPFGDL
ncbi:MAG: hypothetical protein QOG08_818, partial [Chloroflexota bacterium]|nr:hypothetical protein [Chloroflexota bacterium]